MGSNDGKLVIFFMLLAITLFFYVSLPFMFRGPAASLFVIHNHDIKGHEVAIEVFDQHNKSIINETYLLEPRGDVSRSRPFSLRFHREKREYIFKVTMDNQITSTAKLEFPNSHAFADIRLYYRDYGDIPYENRESPEIVPIFIEFNEMM
ncbi:MAG: hypothetical protein PHF18_14280 [Methanosarcina sp.]|uniref:hypothetical protein n=1 Tax=Methanosarcina sp. TaxID=2213 RepID=UPI00262B2C28|nr:hypothetical protein [Methanosarcina sp.]MDD3247995.1 hypothetical protein [Methanosarcina sp.]MDD4249960.1 hypothetical protein [Methanosarcina sp.]